MLQFMALQRVGHNLVTEKQQLSKWSKSLFSEGKFKEQRRDKHIYGNGSPRI